MFSVNFYFFIFLLFFQQASTQGFNITELMGVCLPVAAGLQLEPLSIFQLQQGCQSLILPYPEMLDLRCCELEYQQKKILLLRDIMDVCHFWRITLIMIDMKI